MRVNWVEEEIRLLLSFYQKMQSGDMNKSYSLVIQASEAIRNLSINKEYSQNDPKFRNPNGIALKLANFLFLDPNYSGKGMKGCSTLDKKLFKEVYMTDISEKRGNDSQNNISEIEKIIKAFIEKIPKMGVKGSAMGHSNLFNGLAQEFDLSYAGSTVKAPKVEYLNTSPVISFGLGRFTHVPWIVFTNYDQKVMAGIYPALLFYTEEQKIILAYGVSESKDSNINWNENIIKGLTLVRDILPSTDKYLSSYVYKMYDIPNNLNLLNIDELILNLEKVIGDFHEQFQHKSEILKQSIQMKTPQYPFEFKNWFSSNIGGVRLPMNNKSGRPIGDQIIEGKIHQLIREMISDFKVTKGKFLCVLVGGPGNGKTDLMEFASDIREGNFAKWI